MTYSSRAAYAARPLSTCTHYVPRARDHDYPSARNQTALKVQSSMLQSHYNWSWKKQPSGLDTPRCCHVPDVPNCLLVCDVLKLEGMFFDSIMNYEWDKAPERSDFA